MRTKADWGTRELAELAGTTLKTVRHYHRIGLLEEPERAANGYKQGAASYGPRNWSAFLHAIAELHNPAQIDVLQRANVILDRDKPAG